MRILQIAPVFVPDIGGINTHMVDLCQYLSGKKANNVQVITFKPYSRKFKWIRNECVNPHFHIRRYWWLVGHFFDVIEKYPLLSFLNVATGLTFYSLYYGVRNHKKIDVIHAHGLNAAFAAKWLKIIYKKRLVVSIHAIYGIENRPFLGKLVKWVLNDADKILILSDAAKKEYLKLGLDNEKIGRFTYWVDQNKFKIIKQRDCRKKLNLENKFTVIFVGRFIPIKGIDIVTKLSKTFPEIQFVMVGGGLMEKYVRQEAEKNKNLKLFENIDNNDMPSLYNAADVLIIPSLYEEGYGRVIIEALSCGLPVIGSRRGGIKEAINENVGILVEPKFVNFKKAVEEVFKNKNKLAGLKKNTFSYSRLMFNVSNAKIISNNYDD